MLQRIHNILAWITINTKTEASIWALKLQTRLTNRYPHLNAPAEDALDSYTGWRLLDDEAREHLEYLNNI